MFKSYFGSVVEVKPELVSRVGEMFAWTVPRIKKKKASFFLLQLMQFVLHNTGRALLLVAALYVHREDPSNSPCCFSFRLKLSRL